VFIVNNTNSDNSLVLIVDDHQPAAEMASRIFETKGYRVICSFDGADALEQATTHLPDLIVLDVMMPGMNGFEVLEHLRNQDRTVNIPTILVTAKDTAADIEQGLMLGADDYLPKPFDPRELLARANSKIESRRLREQLQRRTKELQSLLRISEELSYSLDIDNLENLLVYLMLDLLPCEVVGLIRLSENKDIANAVISEKGGDIITDEFDLSALLLNASQFTDARLWDAAHDSAIGDFPNGSIIPLKQLDDIHGYFLIGSYEPLDDSHLRLLEGIARQATLALRNAELFELKANYAERLESTVQERTAELRKAHEMLVRSEKLASIGQLAAAFAHEINNPLMPIVVNLQGMLEDIAQGISIREQDIQHTIDSAYRIERMIRRLLDFSRKRDQSRPDGEILYVDDVFQGVIELSNKHFEHSGVQITAELPRLSPVFGNKDQLEQVFLNIMLNAKDAMPNGGKLFIELFEEQEHITIQVVDTGIGIADDKIGHIFDPFVSDKEGGTGLGLFITHEVIQSHDGTIDVMSNLNEGTRFIIRLPIWDEEV
jgi:signal transduction histidine kinase